MTSTLRAKDVLAYVSDCIVVSEAIFLKTLKYLKFLHGACLSNHSSDYGKANETAPDGAKIKKKGWEMDEAHKART